MNVSFPYLGFGIGLRPPHYDDLRGRIGPIEWLEVISENFMGPKSSGTGGRHVSKLLALREQYPIVMHGVSLSIGSADPLDRFYLQRLRNLAERVEPMWISDHLCWGGVGGVRIHDLLPLRFDRVTLKHVCDRIQTVQEFLQRPLVLENVSSYVEFRNSEFTEAEFVREVLNATGAKMLLDVNNVFVSAVNHDFSPQQYLDTIPTDAVVQYHLAGHDDTGDILVDTHDRPVRSEVWQLFRNAVKRFGLKSTLMEWDENIPALEVIEGEILRAKLEADGDPS